MKFPINIENKSKYLCNSLYIYNSIYHNRLSLCGEYRNKLEEVGPNRKKAISQIVKAIEHNSLLLLNIIEYLKKQITVDEIVKHGYFELAMNMENNDLKSYLGDFKYLKRDWGGTIKGEKEISIITKCLSKVVDDYLNQNEEALFLGGGLGRLAWELTPCFKKVYTIDKSYSMAFFFNKLFSEDIDFYEINEDNVLNVNQSAIKIKASLANSNVNLKNAKKKFKYIIGDVLSLPFDNNKFSLVSSVYFTDVIAIRLYINEIKRVLKTDGLFVHFGPLKYFFSEIKERLSSEEIIKKFEASGFVTLENKVVKTEFLPLSSGMTNAHINNWFFVAKLGEAKQYSDINHEVYYLRKPIKYFIKGQMDDSKEIVELTNAVGQSFVNASSVLEILNLFKKEKKLNIVVNEVKKKHNLSKDEVKEVEIVILKLINQQFLIRKEIN